MGNVNFYFNIDDINELRDKINSAEISIITHDDMDGAFSAITLMREFNIPASRVFFSQPQIINDDMMISYVQNERDEYMETLPEGKLVVLDLPLPSARRTNDVILWCDHHIGNSKEFTSEKVMPKFVFYDSEAGSATQIINLLFPRLSEETVLNVTKHDSGRGFTCELDDLDSLTAFEKISGVFYYEKTVINMRWYIDLVANNKMVDVMENERVKLMINEIRRRREFGRELVWAAEFYNGLLIIDASELFGRRANLFYKDYGPIFNLRKKAGEFDSLERAELIGVLNVSHSQMSGMYKCRVSGNSICNKTVKSLIKNKKISFRDICRKMGGEGHDSVCGFGWSGNKYELLRKVKKIWDEEFMVKYENARRNFENEQVS